MSHNSDSNVDSLLDFQTNQNNDTVSENPSTNIKSSSTSLFNNPINIEVDNIELSAAQVGYKKRNRNAESSVSPTPKKNSSMPMVTKQIDESPHPVMAEDIITTDHETNAEGVALNAEQNCSSVTENGELKKVCIHNAANLSDLLKLLASGEQCCNRTNQENQPSTSLSGVDVDGGLSPQSTFLKEVESAANVLLSKVLDDSNRAMEEVKKMVTRELNVLRALLKDYIEITNCFHLPANSENQQKLEHCIVKLEAILNILDSQ